MIKGLIDIFRCIRLAYIYILLLLFIIIGNMRITIVNNRITVIIFIHIRIIFVTFVLFIRYILITIVIFIRYIIIWGLFFFTYFDNILIVAWATMILRNFVDNPFILNELGLYSVRSISRRVASCSDKFSFRPASVCALCILYFFFQYVR